MKSILLKTTEDLHSLVGEVKGNFSYQVASEVGLLLLLHFRGRCETAEIAQELVGDMRSWALFKRLLDDQPWPDR